MWLITPSILIWIIVPSYIKLVFFFHYSVTKIITAFFNIKSIRYAVIWEYIWCRTSWRSEVKWSEGAKNPDFKFAWMYMNMVLTLLQFIRVSREGLWLLHLASIEKLCTYFFSRNRLKYAQFTPEYIAKIYDSRETKQNVWEI